MRLDPRIGAASSISVEPKGNDSSAATGESEATRRNGTSRLRQVRKFIDSPWSCLDEIAAPQDYARALEHFPFRKMRMAGTSPAMQSLAPLAERLCRMRSAISATPQCSGKTDSRQRQ